MDARGRESRGTLPRTPKWRSHKEVIIASVCWCLVIANSGDSAATALCAGPEDLDIYSIDVEGGQSTLFVSPRRNRSSWMPAAPASGTPAASSARGEAGWPHADDYLVVTHFDGDHVGA